VRLAVVAVAALVLASPAAAKTKTAQHDGVRATVTWQPGPAGTATNVRLRIVRSGHAVVSAKLGLSAPQAIRVRDLDGDGEPEVILDVYTGGAHCCFRSRIYRFAGSSYVSRLFDFGNAGYKLRDPNGDGRPEFLTADNAFAYAFTDYADSALPIRILSYRAGRMTNATRQFPALIRTDASRLWKAFLTGRDFEHPDSRGILAAWMADQYLLGIQAAGWRTMAKLNAHGELAGRPGDTIWPKNGAYLASLKKFLVKDGYAGKNRGLASGS